MSNNTESCVCVNHTCEHNPPLALLLHPAMFFAWQRVRRLEHEAADVVALLKVSLLLWRLFLIEVRLDKRHLDVGELRVQFFGVYLRKVVAFNINENAKHYIVGRINEA